MNITEIFKSIVLSYFFLFIFVYTSTNTMAISFKIKESKETIALKKDFKWINEDIYRIIKRNCKKYNLDIVLVCSVIQYESGTYCGNDLKKMKTVRSYMGAIGMMQLMPVHLPKNPKALEDPKINIEKGCWYLSKCIKKARTMGFKKIYAEACRMYNSGLNGKRIKYKGWAYVNRIQRMYNKVSVEFENYKMYLANI